MKQLIVILLLILLVSCKKDNLDFLNGPWEVNTLMNIELNTRPENYSSTRSPDSTDIELILTNQNDFYKTINQKLGINCIRKFKIYIFNNDEAAELIGTNTGGSANSDRGEIYNAFYEKPLYFPDLDLYSYLGKHELVHLIANNTFGNSNNTMISEGYAVALDNTYGAKYGENGELIKKLIRESMQGFVKNDLILTPNELLNSTYTNNEHIYYPQYGIFINWLFGKYGTENINKLYAVDKEAFKTRFKELIKIDFDDLEDEYINYCRTEFK